jgi:phosphatidylserine decarboxylase
MVVIRKEGFSSIVGFALSATLLTVVSSLYAHAALQLLAILNWILVILAINFFRDPERRLPPGDGLIIAPADGKVIDTRTVREGSFLHAEVTRISIFMSVFDVHVNRAPIGGRVEFLDYHPGIFVAAFRDNASEDNEHLSIGFLGSSRDDSSGGGEHRVLIKLVAGFLARRILFFRQLKDEVRQGERIGMIKFGSRVEVYLPAQWDVAVEKGQRVRAGETVVGRLRKS